MRNNLVEFVLALLVIVLSFLILNPLELWMSDFIVMCMLAFVLVFFSVFIVFVFKEKATDERQVAHRALSGRNAFIAGAIVIMIGIIEGGYHHNLDPWLVISISVMILIKIITGVWAEWYR